MFEYLICAICPVALSKPGLGYLEAEGRIGSRVRDWVVGAPDTAFIFPAFTDRSTDIHATLFYTKNTKEPHSEFMANGLGCGVERTATEQKMAFHSIVRNVLGAEDEHTEDILMDIQQNLSDMIEEYQETIIVTTPHNTYQEVVQHVGSLSLEEDANVLTRLTANAIDKYFPSVRTMSNTYGIPLLIMFMDIAVRTVSTIIRQLLSMIADFVPILDEIKTAFETVKGYAKHESGIFEEFAKARQVYQQASTTGDVKAAAQANTMLSNTLSRLIAVSEQYPELKADSHFSKVMSELSETEDKIAYARQFYNDVVTTYNTKREIFPSSIIAGMFNFQEAQLYEAKMKIDKSKLTLEEGLNRERIITNGIGGYAASTGLTVKVLFMLTS